jgi:hypothetical protein
MSNIPARTTPHSDPLVVASGGWLATREQSRAARDMTRTRLWGAVIAARDVTRIEAVEEVSVSALLAATQVSALEGALAQQTPQARARLQHIADTSSVAMAGIVVRAGKGI